MANEVYVVMTDKFMSGWGMAQGKINKLIFICEDREQAEIVAENAKNRGDMKYINITNKKPSYDSKSYLIQEKTIKCSKKWYKQGAF